MVENVTSLTGNGLRDWLIQRLTAIVLAAYALFLLAYIIICAPLTFDHWHGLFSHGLMRVFTVLALLSVFYHSWIGLWTIFTDYIKCPYLRLTLQTLVVVVLLGYLVWGIDIVWGF
jgi:succinate dehydrogenase / fumarate reductase, membrane anchor subunit